MHLAVLAACVLAVPPTQEKKPMTPRMMTTVELQGGKAWKPELPPERQDLSGHFARAKADFDKGELLMNGPLVETMHGFYLYDEDVAKTQARLAGDEGLDKNVLSLVEVRPWAVLIDHSMTPLEGKQLFVLEYAPGVAYARGQPLEQQPEALVKAHLEYVRGKGALVYLGGPVDPQAGRGRYVLAAASKEAVIDFVRHDPGITSQLFSVSQVLSWQPFQRQALKPRG